MLPDSSTPCHALVKALFGESYLHIRLGWSPDMYCCPTVTLNTQLVDKVMESWDTPIERLMGDMQWHTTAEMRDVAGACGDRRWRETRGTDWEKRRCGNQWEYRRLPSDK